MGRFSTLLQHLIPKNLISRLTGKLAKIEQPYLVQILINLFIQVYGIDMSEVAQPDIRKYRTFNAFFTRALAKGTRTIADGAVLVCPADGTVSQIGAIEKTTILQAKGIDYDLDHLFDGDTNLASLFVAGAFVTIYLAPQNYHRVHLPLAGQAEFLRYVPGTLFSVDQTTARQLPRLYCRNERVITVFKGASGGWFSVIMIAAMNVGDIQLIQALDFRNRPLSNFSPLMTHILDMPRSQSGEEFGRFNLGSTVIVMASPGTVQWHNSIGCGSSVKVGQALGTVRPPPL